MKELPAGLHVDKRLDCHSWDQLEVDLWNSSVVEL
jgi:hypothetical protein